MGGEHWTKVVTTAEDLQHSGREVIPTELDELQITVWCIRRRLDDHRVPGIERGSYLAEREKYGIVPGHNATAHSERRVSIYDLLFFVFFEDLFWQLHGTESFDPRHSHADFLSGLGKRLPLLESQKTSELLLMGGNGIGEREKRLSPFVKWCVRPWLEGFPSARYCVVDIFLGRDRDFGIRLFRRRVDVVASFGGGGQFIVNDIMEGLETWSTCKAHGDRTLMLLTVKSSLGAWPSTPLATPLRVV